jgi:FkbM family methyltransferase
MDVGRSFEPELVSLLKRALKPWMSVLDLGANIGYFKAIAARLVSDNGQVHAFEPMPDNFVRLRKNRAALRVLFHTTSAIVVSIF